MKIPHYKNKINRFLICSFLGLALFSVLVFSILGIYMARQNTQAVYEVGNLYMDGIGEQVSRHFETTIQLRFGQMEGLTEVVSSENTNTEALYQELAYRASVRNFSYLALCSPDGEFETILGDPIRPRRPDPLIEALNSGERRVLIGEDTVGNEVVIFGVNASYPMSDGSQSTGLVGAVPIAYITDTFSLGSQDSLLYCHIIRGDGTFVIDSTDSHSPDYFTSIRNQYLDDKTEAVEQYLEGLRQALDQRSDYSAQIQINQDRWQIYEIPMPYSEWHLLMVMPYEALNSVVNGMSSQRLAIVLASCGFILILLLVIFYQYYRMTTRQLYELEKARKEALKATNAKSEFLSNMSHDIRTPMNAIVGMTSIALNNVSDPGVVQNCLKKIALSGKHLLGLINDILDLSKIESGKMTLSYAQVSLKEIVEGIVGIVQPQIRAKKQHFNVRTDHITSEELICDSVRLNQILLNLLSNAVKFTPEGGTIELSFTEEASPRGDNYVQIHIYVKDNGIGMSSDFLQKMYDSYARADNERVHKTEGAGLGMSIVKYIVNAMNGKIEVQSEPDKGTEFHLTLDFEKAAVSDEEMLLPPWNVLVVDDDEDLCRTAVQTLETIGITADWTLSGEDALKKVTDNSYEIILLDWNLPGMNGLQTAREIRSRIGTSLPILLISAYDWSEFETAAIHAGINGFISKPLFKSTLFYGLKQYMNVPELNGASSDPYAVLAGRRILLAEDNELNWEIARELLSDLKLELDWAEDGKICLDKFESSEAGYYDAILMDLRMPSMNGYEATKAIRQLSRPDAKTIPIIAMTADAFAEDAMRCIQAGMNAHIAKPIDVSRLAQILKNCITD